MNRPNPSGHLTNLIISNPLWNSFDSSEEDRELWHLEHEISTELERIENKHQDLYPIGKSGNEVKQIVRKHSGNYADDDDDDEEEEDDNDDDDSDSHDDDDDEEIDMDIEDQDSPTF